MGSGDLKTISAILDRHPELVNANTDIDQRALMPVDYTGAPSKPRDMLTLPFSTCRSSTTKATCCDS